MEGIRSTPFDPRRGEFAPSHYYGPLLDRPGPEQRRSLRLHLAYIEDVFRVGGIDPAGRDVVEVGSGLGIGLVACLCLGAARATGIEIVDWQADWVRAYAMRLPDEIAGKLRVSTGSATELPFEDASVDTVLSLEAISHYLHYRPFLREAYRILRPGGVLVVSDGNNGLNPRIRRHTESVWASHEIDPRSAPHDPESPWLFVEKRAEIVRTRAPGLPEPDVYDLALSTAGMVRGEILVAVDAFLCDGRRPSSRYRRGELSVHPVHEMAMERLFDPFALGRELTSCGFRVKVRGHWGGASGRTVRIANDMLAALSPLTMRTARGFRIAASKPLSSKPL